jgi:hypothetical protein
MFQYAAAKAHAVRNDTALKLDRSYIKFYEKNRELAINALRIDARIGHRRKPSDWAVANQQRDEWICRLRFRASMTVREQSHRYDATLRDAPGSAYMIGYWQAEQYFTEIADQLREQFVPRRLSAAATAMASQIAAAGNPVSIHVRRGDLVKNPETQRLHGLCSADYYARAAELITDRTGPATFFVFSDDPDWCKTELRLPSDPVIASGATAAHEDLHLQTLCDHHVTANSSFSWWGAWLGEQEQTVTVAPDFLVKELPIDTRDFFPDRWVQLPQSAA